MKAGFRFRVSLFLRKVILQRHTGAQHAPWDIEVHESDWRDATEADIADFVAPEPKSDEGGAR